MKLRPLSSRQFVWETVLAGFGFALWLSPGDVLWNLASLPFLVAAFSLPDWAKPPRPLRAAQIVAIMAALAALAAVVVVSNSWLTPGGEAAVLRVVRHPLVVLPLWAVVQLLLYRAWRIGRAHGEGGAVSAH